MGNKQGSESKSGEESSPKEIEGLRQAGELNTNHHKTTSRYSHDGFSSIVYDAAGSDKVEQLQKALATHGHLIDTPHPLERNHTPMHHAAANGRAFVVETLVRSGSKALDTPQHETGTTPLHLAARYGHIGVVEVLVRLGSRSLDIPNNNGMRAMHYAAKNGHGDVVEALVRLGSRSLDALDNLGMTPLCYASTSSAETAGILIAVGADRNKSTDFLQPEIELVRTTMTEDVIAEVRYRVWFSHSLLWRLLFELRRPP